jgi:hypothetical protein
MAVGPDYRRIRLSPLASVGFPSRNQNVGFVGAAAMGCIAGLYRADHRGQEERNCRFRGSPMRNRVVLVAAVMAFCFGTSVAFAQGGGGKSAKSMKSGKGTGSQGPAGPMGLRGSQGAQGLPGGSPARPPSECLTRMAWRWAGSSVLEAASITPRGWCIRVSCFSQATICSPCMSREVI